MESLGAHLSSATIGLVAQYRIFLHSSANALKILLQGYFQEQAPAGKRGFSLFGVV
ncbi:MAG: hypothetical protein ACP5R6_08960 [Chlorobaculum sp.]